MARDGLTHDVVSAEISPPAPRVGEAVTARAPAFLVRDQPFDGTAIFLWPSPQGREQEYVDELVYHVRFTDGSYRMVRWDSGFTVTLDGNLGEFGLVADRTRQVVAELVRRTGLQISIGTGGACRILLDPSVAERNAVATASYSFRGPTVVGATVRFATIQEISGSARADYLNTLLHEMGHVVGLGHSVDTRDVMTPGAGPGTKVGEFQPGEALSLHMMYAHRTPGNVPPDRHPSVAPRSMAAATPSTVEIVD